MSSTCLASHWLISPPLAGMRASGVTGATAPALAIWAAVQHELQGHAEDARVPGPVFIS